MSLPDPLDTSAAAVLRSRWGITAAPERDTLGTSRETWSIDGQLWLSHSDSTEETPFRRETELLRALPDELARCGARWRVPEVVPAADGRLVVESLDGVWRLTRHLAGDAPDPHDPETYPALARRLAELHAALGQMPESLRVREHGVVERASPLVESFITGAFSSASQEPGERRAVRAVAKWLAPRLGELSAEPRQLTHGDWIPGNIKVSGASWGVLDWEFCRVDPVVMDLAQSCCTVLIWSGLSSPDRRIRDLVQRYAAHSGRAVSLESVKTAMALYWLHNANHVRERNESVGGFEHELARQPGRLVAVGKYVGALSEL